MSRNPLLFDADSQSIIGALAKNPRGESYNYAINGWGFSGYENRFNRFKNSWVYKRLMNDSSGLSELRFSVTEDASMPASFKSKNPAYKPMATRNIPRNLNGLKAIQYMKDTSEMLILDYLMRQNDRFGNIHQRNYLFSFEGGRVVTEKYKGNTDQVSKVNRGTAVVIPKMLLKDNDCGMVNPHKSVNGVVVGAVRYGSIVEYNPRNKAFNTSRYAHNFLNSIYHIAPKTYEKVMWLEKYVNTEYGKLHFIDELRFSISDFKYFKQRVEQLSQFLYDRCEAGKLHIDLDHTAFMNGEDLSNPGASRSSRYCAR
jgi:hypothetical protein